MKIRAFLSPAHRALTTRFALWICSLSAAYSAVCTPLLLWVTGDILISGTIMPTLLDLVMSALNFAVYWIAFAYLFYTVSRFGTRSVGALFGVYVGASAFRYVVAQLMTYWVLRESFAWVQVIDLLTYVALDALMLLAAWLLTVRAARRVSEDGGLSARLPMERLFDFKNAAIRTVAWLAAIPSAVHLLTRLIYDFSILGGVPSGLLDWIWVIFGYLSEVIFALIGHMVIVLTVNAHALKDMET